MEVTVQLPESIARSFGETASEVGRRLLEHAAIEGYREGQLSHRQVAEMLGVDYWAAESFLKDHQVPLNYSLADLEADRAALAKILSHP